MTYAELFRNVHNLQGTMELAMACATFGLVLGGLVGGPVTKRLIKRYGLKPTDEALKDSTETITYDPEDRDQVTPRRMMETLFIITLCMAGGAAL